MTVVGDVYDSIVGRINFHARQRATPDLRFDSLKIVPGYAVSKAARFNIYFGPANAEAFYFAVIE